MNESNLTLIEICRHHPIDSVEMSSPDYILSVEGMMCQKNCAATVAGALRQVIFRNTEPRF